MNARPGNNYVLACIINLKKPDLLLREEDQVCTFIPQPKRVCSKTCFMEKIKILTINIVYSLVLPY